jgi:hypothetical protein
MSKRISMGTSRANEEFKQQFMQYLEVIKEKISEMELKVKES